jgi:hypothetical protein
VKQSLIPDAGYDLFYVGPNPIEAGKVIAYYSASEIGNGQGKGEYVLQYTKNHFLDAADPKNFAGRYINTPRGSNKQANVRFSSDTKVVWRNERATVSILTTKRVDTDTELLVPYSNAYKLP